MVVGLDRTGRLTEEEKQRRLAEMSGNATVHEEARWQRLEQARKKDDAEDATLAVHPQGAATPRDSVVLLISSHSASGEKKAGGCRESSRGLSLQESENCLFCLTHV